MFCFGFFPLSSSPDDEEDDEEDEDFEDDDEWEDQSPTDPRPVTYTRVSCRNLPEFD